MFIEKVEVLNDEGITIIKFKVTSFNKNVKYILVGNLASKIGEALKIKGIEPVCFDDNLSVSRYIVENLDKSNTIFLKASRSMKFEEILEKIKE